MKFSYQFDFGENPAVLYDAWFRKKALPILGVSVVFFPLCFYLLDGFLRFVFPSIAFGVIAILIGVYIHRRTLAKKRIYGINNPVFDYEINDSGITYANELGNGTIKWGFKGKLIPCSRFLLIESNEVGLLPLPLDSPTEVVEFVKGKLQINR